MADLTGSQGSFVNSKFCGRVEGSESESAGAGSEKEEDENENEDEDEDENNGEVEGSEEENEEEEEADGDGDEDEDEFLPKNLSKEKECEVEATEFWEDGEGKYVDLMIAFGAEG